jgi:ATP-binding cassette subfamily F protein uup
VRPALESTRSGKSILELQGLRLEVEGRTLVRDLDLVLRRGQRLGIIGPNGCGKTTLLRTITAQLEPAAGRVLPGKNTRLSYLGQLRDDLDESQSILENVAEGRSHVVVGDGAVEARAYLDRFLFPPQRLGQPVSSLSGGERTRVALAKILHHTANLVLLDEPLNDLDLPTISAIEEMLIEFEGTALVVTHDRWFLDRVATGILAFEEGGEVVQYEGSYTTYRALRAARELAEREESSGGEQFALHRGASEGREQAQLPRPARDRPKKPAALTYAERLELAGLVPLIEEAEARVAALQAQLAAPETYRDRGQEATRLAAELRAARDEEARLMDRWEELETKQQG